MTPRPPVRSCHFCRPTLMISANRLGACAASEAPLSFLANHSQETAHLSRPEWATASLEGKRVPSTSLVRSPALPRLPLGSFSACLCFADSSSRPLIPSHRPIPPFPLPRQFHLSASSVVSAFVHRQSAIRPFLCFCSLLCCCRCLVPRLLSMEPSTKRRKLAPKVATPTESIPPPVQHVHEPVCCFPRSS